jgi:Nucleotidyl transferase AbiEii toxin, Type IV TA system
MSSTAEPYRDGVALWAAATDRAKTEAVARGANSGALLRQFVDDRLLARVFHAPDAPWVLKGGTAVLARVDDARTTKDVDLLGELDDIDVALGRLRSAAAVDLGGLGTGKTVNYS